MYEYRSTIVKIVDGDTVDVDIDLGFGTWLHNERVRIMGIDTPESRTSDKTEKVFGLAAKQRLTELLGPNPILRTMVSKKGEDMKGKFGRILGDFKTKDGQMITDIMIAEGHAVLYEGQNKDDVHAAHMLNRERLIAEGVVTL
jgi:micrococcal nuclease